VLHYQNNSCGSSNAHTNYMCIENKFFILHWNKLNVIKYFGCLIEIFDNVEVNVMSVVLHPPKPKLQSASLALWSSS
jgi:hypothetical protein